MVCAEANIPDCDFDNSVSYIASWLEKSRSDRKEIFRAAADAQRIADYLLAFHPDWAARGEHESGGDNSREQDSAADETSAAQQIHA